MALQLERSHVLAVTVLTCGVTFPALAVLFLQLQVVFHVVHEPEDQRDRHRQKRQTRHFCDQLMEISNYLTV